MPGFRPLGEDLIHRGPLISLLEGRFEAPDGSTFEREIVRHPGAVSVVPVLGSGADATVVLVRQYRAAIDTELLEIPAGKRDVEGEAPERTAGRELVEEIGMQAGRLDLLARFFNSPGFSDEDSWCYLGRELTDVATDLQGIEEQHMTVERVPLGDVPGLVRSGAIVDAKTIIGCTLALELLRTESPTAFAGVWGRSTQ